MSRIKALFLDRDGIINVDHGYVYKSENFDFVEGIFDLCKDAVALGYKLVVVTNQAGIGRGYYTEEDFWKLMNWVTDRFQDQGLKIEEIYFCPDHPQKGTGQFKRFSIDRKPGPGMLIRAANDLSINLTKSIIVGDSYTDIYAGLAAGLQACIHVGEPVSTDCKNVYCVKNLFEARKIIKNEV